MYRIVLLMCVLACVGCATAPPPPAVDLQPVEDTNQAKEVTRIEFAVFGKFKDKLKERGGRRGGADEECPGGQCEQPPLVERPQPQPQEPSLNPLYLAAALTPVGLAVCLALGIGSFLVVKNARDT